MGRVYQASRDAAMDGSAEGSGTPDRTLPTGSPGTPSSLARTRRAPYLRVTRRKNEHLQPCLPVSPAIHPRRPDLRAIVSERARNRPGVYRFQGPRGEVLYVGKSVRVRARLLSYFRDTGGSKERELLRVATGVEWEYTPNEFEALLREFRLIRSFRPRFNVRHRRERRFAWIRLTPGAAPRLAASRSPRPDGGHYYGPFPAPRSLPRILQDLSHEVGLRDCPDSTPIHFADQLDLLATTRTPGCVRAELGSCPGPCAGRCDSHGYARRVEEAVAFLEGRSDRPLQRLESRMERAAAAREYERAARLRDQRERLADLRRDLGEFSRYLRSLRFIYRVPGAGDGDGRRYVIVGGRVRLTLPLAEAKGEGDRIRTLLRAPDPPPSALSPGEREELFLVSRWFRRRPEELDRTRPLPPHDPPSNPLSGPVPLRSETPPHARAAPTAASGAPAPSPADRGAP
jgi:excinuclease ABC subunit C